MRKRTAIRGGAVLSVGALCAVVALVSTSGASVTSPAVVEAAGKAEVQSLAPPNSSETTKIYAQAMRAAEAASDSAPTSVEMTVAPMGRATALVESEHGAASNSLIDPRTAQPWTASAVYVVTMHGTFTLSSIRVPKGHKVPSGSVLTLMIDRQLDRIVGVHVSDTNDDLHQLGAAVTTWGSRP